MLIFTFGKLSGLLRSLAHLPHPLKNFMYLQKLQISHNSGDTHHLSKGLKCCKSLQELYISLCQIDILGANKIASSFSHVIDISSNSVNSLSDVILHMKHDSSLGHLDFSENFRILMSHDPYSLISEGLQH